MTSRIALVGGSSQVLSNGLPGEGLPRYSIRASQLCCKGLSMEPKWRILCLTSMGVAFVILLVATMTTDWREDQDDRINVFVTHGLWRICRDIKFGATIDHKCLSELANIAPDWFQTVRAFMLIAVISCFAAFTYGVYLVASLPVIKNRNYPNASVSLALPGVLMLVGAVCTLIGAAVYAVATTMNQALYFPENLPPTWANSWAQVWAKRNSIPSDRPEVASMKMKYGYSFGLAWFSLVTTTASMIVNFLASGN